MAKSLKKWKPQTFEATEVNINPFKIGEQVPLEFFMMYNSFDKFTEIPIFMDGDDWITYGERCNDIPDETTSERLFKQWQNFVKMTKENERT